MTLLVDLSFHSSLSCLDYSQLLSYFNKHFSLKKDLEKLTYMTYRKNIFSS